MANNPNDEVVLDGGDYYNKNMRATIDINNLNLRDSIKGHSQ
jgi:hypothetical protein